MQIRADGDARPQNENIRADKPIELPYDPAALGENFRSFLRYRK